MTVDEGDPNVEDDNEDEAADGDADADGGDPDADVGVPNIGDLNASADEPTSDYHTKLKKAQANVEGLLGKEVTVKKGNESMVWQVVKEHQAELSKELRNDRNAHTEKAGYKGME